MSDIVVFGLSIKLKHLANVIHIHVQELIQAQALHADNQQLKVRLAGKVPLARCDSLW